MRFLLTNLFFCLLAATSVAQDYERYVVIADELNVRKGPGTHYSVLSKLEKGAEIRVDASLKLPTWKRVVINGKDGFVASKYIKPKDNKDYSDWDKKNYSTGETPECYNIKPKYDSSIDNFLRVSVGHNDVLAKLMRINNNSSKDTCYRVFYIRSDDTCTIDHIPQGKYYLKIAYGKDWREKIKDGRCYGRFTQNAFFEKGKDTLNFKKVIKRDRTVKVTSHKIKLQTVKPSGQVLEVEKITQEEFNK